MREVMGKEDYWYRVEKDLDRVGELERGNKVERDLRGKYLTYSILCSLESIVLIDRERMCYSCIGHGKR